MEAVLPITQMDSTHGAFFSSHLWPYRGLHSKSLHLNRNHLISHMFFYTNPSMWAAKQPYFQMASTCPDSFNKLMLVMFKDIFHAWQTTWQVHPQLCASQQSAAGLTVTWRWWTWWTEVRKHNYGLPDITKRAPGTNPSQVLVVKNN